MRVESLEKKVGRKEEAREEGGARLSAIPRIVVDFVSCRSFSFLGQGRSRNSRTRRVCAGGSSWGIFSSSSAVPRRRFELP